ncbi:uncharacterized mitochondrial protein-like protein, partial [Tanacetum coccineum]
KELCTEFEKLMHKKFQMSSIGELTFFLGLQVMQKEDGIFISQDKYVDEILKKFGFSTVKTTSTPMETSKPLMKDETAEAVDVHLYRSMIGSLMYLTSSRLDIMFVVCACARFQVTPKVSHIHSVKRIFRYLKGQPKLGLWYPKDLLFDLEAYTDSDYASVSLDRKSTIGGCQFLGSRLILCQCKKQTVVANSTTKVEYIVASNCCGQIDDWNGKTKSKVTEIPQSSKPTNLDENEVVHKERGYSVERAPTTTTSLDAEQGSGGSPRCQEAMGDTIAQTRSERVSTPSYDSPILGVNTLGSDEERIELKELIDMCTKLSNKVLDLENGRYGHDISTAEVTTAIIPSDVDVSAASPIRPVDDLTTDDITLAETLMKIKNNKGKGIMQEPEKPVKVKGKDQIKYDADVAQRLQAELDEEARLEREREEEASNVTLIEEWDSIEARIDVDAQLAKRFQAKEREQMSVEEQARLLMEFVAVRKKFFGVRKKFFGAKRAEEQRNKPPTKAEQRKKMYTYMKHMAGYKDNKFKGKSFDAIKQMFDKAYKQVNDFVPMDTKSSRKKVDSSRKKAESSKKRTRAVLGEESVKKQKVYDDAEKAELKACLEIVSNDDSDVNIESLATKYPIVDWKTHILAEDIIYYQIIIANGSTKNYKIFSAMLEDFDRQDVLDLYRLVKERFETTSPEGYDRLIWGDLITLFEPIEKKYPLTQEMLSRMLSGRLEVDHECEMAYELIRFITSQYKNFLYIVSCVMIDHYVALSSFRQCRGDRKFYQLSDDNKEMEADETFNDFNYLLKIDSDLFTFDIQGIKTYEGYELNNNMTGDLEEPWSDNRVLYQLCDHICEPYRFKNGKSKWPTCSSDINGFCNGGELPRMVRVGCMTYFQDHKWYDELVDGKLKVEALMHKAKVKGSWEDTTPRVMKLCVWLKTSFENFHELDHDVLVKQEECWNYGADNAGNTQDNQEHKKEHHDPLTCHVRRFEMIKYSFDDDDDYVTIKEHECSDHSKINIDTCQA